MTVDLTNGTFDNPLATGDFSLGGAPAGTTISVAAYVTDTQATLTLAYDSTDFDTNASMSVTANQTALASGIGPATTGTVTITAILESFLAINSTNPGSLTETNLNGATVTVDLTDGTFNNPLNAAYFSLTGAPAGTTISAAAYVTATQATLTLAFDATDFDTNASMSVTALQTALLTGTGPATTGTVTVTAVVEPLLDQIHYRWRNDDGEEGWYTGSWLFRKKITILATQVDANVTNFPVYVNLADLGSDFFANVESSGGDDGGDIRVTTADGATELPREVVDINVGSLTGELHFKAGALSSTANTDFYIYYGNAAIAEPAASATYGSQNVWTNGYVGVWHLGEDAANTGTADLYQDSTSNVNHGDDSVSDTGQTGKLGAGQVFDGTDDSIDVPYTASLNVTNQLTLSGWVKSTTGARHILARPGNGGASAYGGTHVTRSVEDSGSTVTEAYTVPAGSNRILIVNALAEEDGSCDPQKPNGVTYGGVALTWLAGATETTQSHTSLYYLLETDTVLFDAAAHDVVVTYSCSGGDNALVAFSYNGVNQTTPFGTPNSNDGTGSTASVVVSSAVGELVIDTTMITWDDGSARPTGDGGGQVVRVDSADNDRGLQHRRRGGAYFG